MPDHVLFKLADPSKKWEDIAPLNEIYLESDKDAYQLGNDLSILFGVEVRWNWMGSPQGHYCNMVPFTNDRILKSVLVKEIID